MHRDDRQHVPAAALRGLERGDVAGASAFLAQGGEVDARSFVVPGGGGRTAHTLHEAAQRLR